MPDQTTDTPKTVEPQNTGSKTPAKADPTPESDPKFPVSVLIAQADEALGYTPPDVAGAFHDVAPDEEYTKDEAKERVRQWLKQEMN